MNELPYFAVLAQRHAWAEREYARLHADIVEARLTARARAQERSARKRAWVRDRVGGLVRPTTPAPYCARAAARPARPAGVVR
ncbi:hypothetical protein GCM10010402_25630 [Actinomadura luteofluorescens]|uniref:hypothetical protein n=1 Tax=Actinomadura luteofluorescens TaxID=46163 RepID=UPI0021649AED|nr:hypothetical protein [Actinomadura glauciflava]MCR3737695.1 hypothetical protein [Actinomadura glauciflava]